MRLGYACINLELRERDIYTTRTLILQTFEKKGLEYAIHLGKRNVEDLLLLLQHNEAHGYRFFRITSNLFPHMGNPRIDKYIREHVNDDSRVTSSNLPQLADRWAGLHGNLAMTMGDDVLTPKDSPKTPKDSTMTVDIDTTPYTPLYMASQLKICGRYALDHGHRITAHPGQFAQLGSIVPAVVKQASCDLRIHAWIFQLMGLYPHHGTVMIIHGGGSLGDKAASLGRWESQFRELPRWVSQYISLENDEFQYDISDLLPLCEKLEIPLTIDFFYRIVWLRREKARAEKARIAEEQKAGDKLGAKGAQKVSMRDKLEDGASSGNKSVKKDTENKWFPSCIEELISHSDLQRVLNIWKLRGIQPKIHWSQQKSGHRDGTHDTCVEEVPKWLLDWCYTNTVDIMLEVKDKDRCLEKIYKKHFTLRKERGRTEWNIDT